MKRTIFATAIAAVLLTVAVAQETKTLPQVHLGQAGAAPATKSRNPNATPPAPFFCNVNCLLYSGDTDITSPENNGLFNFSNPGVGADGEVYFSFKGTAAAAAKGIYGNYFTNATTIGTNPTPVDFRKGIKEGVGGKEVCIRSGNAVYKLYGQGNFGLDSANYWIKKLNRVCNLKANVKYFAELQPQYNDSGTIGYLESTDTGPTGEDPPKHSCSANGFTAIQKTSFFSSTSFNYTFQNTFGPNGACGGVGCRGFSWGLNGKGVKAQCKS